MISAKDLHVTATNVQRACARAYADRTQRKSGRGRLVPNAAAAGGRGLKAARIRWNGMKKLRRCLNPTQMPDDIGECLGDRFPVAHGDVDARAVDLDFRDQGIVVDADFPDIGVADEFAE